MPNPNPNQPILTNTLIGEWQTLASRSRPPGARGSWTTIKHIMTPEKLDEYIRTMLAEGELAAHTLKYKFYRRLRV